jgi:hypothetical protein
MGFQWLASHAGDGSRAAPGPGTVQFCPAGGRVEYALVTAVQAVPIKQEQILTIAGH